MKTVASFVAFGVCSTDAAEHDDFVLLGTVYKSVYLLTYLQVRDWPEEISKR